MRFRLGSLCMREQSDDFLRDTAVRLSLSAERRGVQYEGRHLGFGYHHVRAHFRKGPFLHHQPNRSHENSNPFATQIKDPVYFPVWGSTSETLKPLIQKMLSKDPDERPSINEILSSELFRAFNPQINRGIKTELGTCLDF